MRIFRIITFGLLGLHSILAEETSAKRMPVDPIHVAVEAFDDLNPSQADETLTSSRKKSSSVTDVLGENSRLEEQLQEPVLVTGKKPKDGELIDISEIPVDPEAAKQLPPTLPKPKGLRVNVERVQSGQGDFKSESVQLLAPFPAKPLHEAPEGWLLDSDTIAPSYNRKVELAPGKSINLTIKPHILVPDADQEHILAIAEPGFEASLGYKQSATVAAALSDSIESLSEDSRRIGIAINLLQQLIVSLPKPDTTNPAEPVSDSAPSIPDAGNPLPIQP